MKYIKDIKTSKIYYKSVTLYNPDSPQQEVIAHFNDFHQATEFITSHGYSIVYLEDQPQHQSQRWGIRQWKS